MRTTVKIFLEEQKVSIKQTVYREEETALLSFPILAGDFWKWEKLKEASREFEISARCQIYQESLKRNREYQENEENIKAYADILRYFRQQNGAHDFQNAIKAIRERKKELEEQQKNLEKTYRIEAARVCIQTEIPLSDKVMIYKDMLYLTSYKQLTFFCDAVKAVYLPGIRFTPLLVTSLVRLRTALRKAEAGHDQPIGIEGGPCLFGHDEVIIEITHDTGEIFRFDYSDSKNYEIKDPCSGDEERLAAHVESYGSVISKMTFQQKKQGITKDEVKSLLYVFAFAHALRAKAIIPIPDMSYRKYLAAICREIRPEIAQQAETEFRELVYGITDQYLHCIQQIQAEYPQVEAEVLHERNESLCRQFYQARAAYCGSTAFRRNLTAHPSKQEAILDYVTMPALPFYRWGTKEVIQIDCISEADSFRKCSKLHGRAFSLHGIFYPEPVCGDGEHTMFSAQNKWKEYLQ